MSTKLWISNKMYLVDEAVEEYIEELQDEINRLVRENGVLKPSIKQLQARVAELEGENKRLRTACDEFIYNESHGEQEGGD